MKIALIPAKQKSLRLPNKNFKLFFGKPMIEHILTEIKKSNYFDKIVISSDNLNLKKKFFYKKFIISKRPYKLTKNDVGLHEIIKHEYKIFLKDNLKIDELWLFLPCSPLIIKKDILEAAKIFKKNKKFPMMSVAKFPVPVEWAMYENNGYLSPVSKKKVNMDSKKLRPYYYDSGNFIAYSKLHLNNFSKKFKYKKYLIPNHKAVDIDTIEDWKLTKILFKNLKNVKSQ